MIRPCRSILPRIDSSAFIDESAQIIADFRTGKVRRELTAEDVASIAGYAERYVEYAKEYRKL